MSMKNIRQQRLRDWFSDKTLPEKEKSYLSQLMNGKASFGEKAARRLEQDYRMPDGYLDADTNTHQLGNPLQVTLTPKQKVLLELFDELPDSDADDLIKNLEDKKRHYDNLLEELLHKKRQKKA
ncbi:MULTISPECIES: hypothetical protein [Photorhabdus]|uniref:Photorhabdus luminescens subsp. laumondii TTO1 complete genome segment 12/17 n=4 Tax=Morganellaceae TaxID=1903414 RepID=Q7N1J6_PHOLL|nr:MULTISPECIES: hypothetical protein [Photorhabdus]AWK43134.1 hypothetical protein A4R40_17320 [Photorhabdus laumondii subsp. laumondii]CAE15850.1 unnamed protein product [Photorhabdus laumondii subsp. laumondii TTO1]